MAWFWNNCHLFPCNGQWGYFHQLWHFSWHRTTENVNEVLNEPSMIVFSSFSALDIHWPVLNVTFKTKIISNIRIDILYIFVQHRQVCSMKSRRFFSFKLLLSIFQEVINIQESISRDTSGALASINNNILLPCNIFTFQVLITILCLLAISFQVYCKYK